MKSPLDPIDTIVFLMLENRSFDHLLGYLSLGPNGRKDVDGLQDGSDWIARFANPAPDGSRSYGVAPLVGPDSPFPGDPPHDRSSIATQLGEGAPGGYPMTGFVKAYPQPLPSTGEPVVMGYWPAEDVPVTDFFAREFAVCDRWFASLPTGTQPNRLMSLSGTSRIQDNATLLAPQDLVYDWLDRHHIRWRVYHDGLPFVSILPNWWDDVITGRGFAPYNEFRLDNKRQSAKQFPQVVFIEPRYTNGPHLQPPTDDHPPTPISNGQRFLLQVYSDLAANPDRWQRSLLIVTWDEHGGFFDHASPRPTSATAGGPYPPFLSTGVRVPAFLISPWAPAGRAFHGIVDHVAVLQLLARKFADGTYSPEVDGRRIDGAPLAPLEQALTLRRPRKTIPFPMRLDTGYTPAHGPMDEVSIAMRRALRKMKTRHPAKVRRRFPELARHF